MALAAFDTLEFVETLKEAGVPEKQAKAFSMAVRKSHESLDVATKQDIADLRRDLAAVEERVDAKLEKLGTELRHEIGELSKNNELLRKDIDTKHESLRKDMDTKHESLRKDTDTKHELLRKDMELMSARFEKRLLLVGVTLGILTLFGQNTLSALLRLFH